MSHRSLTCLLPFLVALLVFSPACQPSKEAAQQRQVAWADLIGPTVEAEMEAKGIPAVSIALIDDQEIVWSGGFGFRDEERQHPADDRTIYRVGSISKLFTDIAVMRAVDRGEIELDAPVQRFLPEFAPNDPRAHRLNLRMLMAHRSGLVREPPAGNYFDPTEPSLEETVRSLQHTSLVYEPEQRTKYSNAAIAVVGRVLEKLQGQEFETCLRKEVLEPLGIEGASLKRESTDEAHLATGWMWTCDGRRFEAPTFALGMAPAGNLYASVRDLAQFTHGLFRISPTADDRDLLSWKSLQEMWTPQFADDDQGFGLGFKLGKLDGAKTVSHGGAVYGFATQWKVLTEEKLGVVVASSLDMSNGWVNQLADWLLRCMVTARAGGPPPAFDVYEPLGEGEADRLAGLYVGPEDRFRIRALNGKAYYERQSFVPLAQDGDALVTDGVMDRGTRIEPQDEDVLVVGGVPYRRVDDACPDPCPQRWRGLIGEYGWDHNTLYVFEENGQLYTLIEWAFRYPLTEVEEDVFAFPDWGLYHGERLEFHRGEHGHATRVVTASVPFERREVGTAEGVTFKIDPVAPIEEIRQGAMAASPPKEEGEFREPELKDLAEVDDRLLFDIRYASDNNFMGSTFYRTPRAFLQEPAAEALGRVVKSVEQLGYGLLVHDAYRPWFVTKMFFDATPESMKIFVADPSKGSRHNRGSAVDLTLYDRRSGEVIPMVGGYDEFSERSFPLYPGGTSRQRWHRDLLRREMEAQDFEVYEFEWWHFDYQDWMSYPILNATFDELEKGA